MPFPYKTILLTGASSGIGLALTTKLLSQGHTVIAVSRTTTSLTSLHSQYPSNLFPTPFDCANLSSIPSFTSKILSEHPDMSCILLNAGTQNLLSFTDPSTIDLQTHTQELTLNYLSPLHMITSFLPHLQSQPQAAIVLVTSGLAVLPLPTVPNYCASKAALHSLAWSLRAQLNSASSGSDDGAKKNTVRVIEILPPAVHTKLHDGQPQHVHDMLANIAMPLDEFLDEAWAGLEDGTMDEIPVGSVRTRVAALEEGKRKAFASFVDSMKGNASKA